MWNYPSFTIGRKNWLFSGSLKGAKASAGVYSLIETSKANGLKPRKYIQFILSNLPGTAFREHPELLEEFLPPGVRMFKKNVINKVALQLS